MEEQPETTTITKVTQNEESITITTQKSNNQELTTTQNPNNNDLKSTQESKTVEQASSPSIIVEETHDNGSSSPNIEVNSKDLSSSTIIEETNDKYDNNNGNRSYVVKDKNVNEIFDINLLNIDDEDTLLAGYDEDEGESSCKENYTDLLGSLNEFINYNQGNSNEIDNIEDVKNQDCAMKSQTDQLIDLGDNNNDNEIENKLMEKTEFDNDQHDNSNHRPIIVADQTNPLEETLKTDAYENKKDNYDFDSDSCNIESSLGMEITRALDEEIPGKQIFYQADPMLFLLNAEIENIRRNSRDINDIHALLEIEKNTSRMIHDQIYTKIGEIDKVNDLNELTRNVYNQHQSVSNQFTEFRSLLQSLTARLKETEATGLLNKRAIDKQRAEYETTCKNLDEKIESHFAQIQKLAEEDKMHYEQRFKEVFLHIDPLQQNIQKVEENYFQFKANYLQLKETQLQLQQENGSKEMQSFYIKNQKTLEQRIHKQRVVADELQLRCDNLESFLKHIDSRERESCIGCKEMEKRYYKYDTFLKEVHAEMRLRAAEEETKFNAIFRKDNERRDKKFEDLRRELTQDATKRYDDLMKKFKNDLKQLKDDIERSKNQQERKHADLFGGTSWVCMIFAGLIAGFIIIWAFASD
ncbi:874_t:CDS:2 [Ambispora gerdemannii]|uniref:874_t:CDS:1 n=1 Tax=Ambispora gerdemannii TaxID=144530 RepID=A0A9N9BBU1_9GLOM|nr:874_t:CDS:2 [Ambispora gerdemannii]